MEDLTDAYENGAYIGGAASFPPRWATEAAAFRERMGAAIRRDLPYGPKTRQRFDLVYPEAAPRGLIVFVHGGYWKAFGKDDWTHLAAGVVARGWACALPSYTLAPEARIGQITAEIVQAVRAAAAEVAGPVVVTGHSAGGHLAARMACADLDLLPGRLARVVPISPLGDLAPLMQTAMNATLSIDDDEAATESPCRQGRRPGVSAHVWVGAWERPAFVQQAGALAAAWGVPMTLAPGRHHFDVIEGLVRPNDPLVAAVLAGV